MLTIWMPDGHDAKQKRRRRQALGYLISGVLIITSWLISYGTQLWWLPLLLETWWIWAVLSLDWGK